MRRWQNNCFSLSVAYSLLLSLMISGIERAREERSWRHQMSMYSMKKKHVAVGGGWLGSNFM